MTTFHCEQAWLGGPEPTSDVAIEIEAGTISSVTASVAAPAGAQRLAGLTMPGLVNTHSHVFHRAIRGHTQSGAADFWAWRKLMYDVAGRLDPDTLYSLARATYAEMALAGITSVGEFHYLHHQQGGRRYEDPNALGHAVVRAANDAGIRITLLDTCYLQGDVDGSPVNGVQRRFSDESWQAWAERVALLADTEQMKVGAAIHSVRAVPREAMRPIAQLASSRTLPLHVHVSEQPAENAACQSAHGVSPTQLLRDEGVLGSGTTAVHATHLTDVDVLLFGKSRTSISMCCTTERDLADGVGPAVQLARAGSPLCVGSDGHMIIDLWEEARAIELDERLMTGTRGHLTVEALLNALTVSGAASIGWNAGRIVTGMLADLVTLRLDTPRMAGARAGNPLAHAVFAASAADVSTVVVGGDVIVADGVHANVPNVGAALEQSIFAALGTKS